MNRRGLLRCVAGNVGAVMLAGTLKDTPQYTGIGVLDAERSDMAFASDVVGGQDALIRSWIKSPNYVAGVSGWIIQKDGTVEFNNGVFRGSLTSGSNPGQHITFNDPVTGDAIDIYDALNRLVFDINNVGQMRFINQPSTKTFFLDQSGWAIGNLNNPPFSQAGIVGASDNTQSLWDIGSGESVVGTSSSELTLFDGVSSGVGNAYIRVQQHRSTGSILGSLVQTDAANNTNNVMHGGTTLLGCGAGGLWNQAHGCSFTPTMAVVTEQGPAGTIPLVFVVDNTAFTATNWQGHAFNGGAAFVGNVSVNVIFLG